MKISNKQTKISKEMRKFREKSYLNERKMRLEREVLSFLRMMAEKGNANLLLTYPNLQKKPKHITRPTTFNDFFLFNEKLQILP